MGTGGAGLRCRPVAGIAASLRCTAYHSLLRETERKVDDCSTESPTQGHLYAWEPDSIAFTKFKVTAVEADMLVEELNKMIKKKRDDELKAMGEMKTFHDINGLLNKLKSKKDLN